jgi:hypothetical protein
VPTAILAILAVGLLAVAATIAHSRRRRAPRLPAGLLDLARSLETTWDTQLAGLRASGVPLNAFDNIVSRTDASGLIPEEVSKAMLTNLSERAEGSAARKLFRSVPVGRAQVRFPVLSALPVAYWVTGDTGLKQTTEVNWANKFLNIEELAVIIPIPENVLDDTDTPIWDQVQPLCEEAAARLIDGTVFFGTNAATAGGIVGDHSAVLAALEADGYDATGGLANRTVRGFVRQARNSQGDRFGEIAVDQDGVEIDGVRYTHPMRGLWPSATGSAELIALDGQEFVMGIRQDISWKLLDQAVIQDNTGAIVYNLAQQDMVAMRMTMRAGWQVSNAINYDQAVEASRYPASVLLKP